MPSSSKWGKEEIKQKKKYELGEILICRVYKKDEEGKLNVNIRWEVVEVEGRNVTIQDIKSKETRTFDEDTIDKHFRYVTVQLVTADKEQQ